MRPASMGRRLRNYAGARHTFGMERLPRQNPISDQERNECAARLPPINLTDESIAALIELGGLIRTVLVDSRYRFVDGRILPPAQDS